MAKEGLGKSCHSETVRRVLREKLQFARDYLNRTPAFWRAVFFADEVKRNLFGPDDRPFIQREANTQLKTQNLRATINHDGGNVMVWTCLSSNGSRNFTSIEERMKIHIYLKLLQENLI